MQLAWKGCKANIYQDQWFDVSAEHADTASPIGTAPDRAECYVQSGLQKGRAGGPKGLSGALISKRALHDGCD